MDYADYNLQNEQHPESTKHILFYINNYNKIIIIYFSSVPGVVSPPVINNNDIGSTTAIIRWNPPIHPNGEITSYTVEVIPIRFKEDPYDTVIGRRQTEGNVLTCIEFLNISAVVSVTVRGNSLSINLTGLSKFFLLLEIYFNPDSLNFKVQ